MQRSQLKQSAPVDHNHNKGLHSSANYPFRSLFGFLSIAELYFLIMITTTTPGSISISIGIHERGRGMTGDSFVRGAL